MTRVFVTRAIPEPGMRLLRAEGYRVSVGAKDRSLSKEEIAKKGKGAHALISLLGDRIDAGLMDAIGSQLKTVSNYAVGVDNIDLAAARERGIRVGNTPDVLTDSVAEHAAALILGIARRVAESDRFVRRGRFTGWEPELLLGTELKGKVFGIVGCGRIGTALAHILAKGFGMRGLYVDAKRNREAESILGMQQRPLEKLLEESDVVSLHVPLLDETRHLIGSREIGRMKRSAFLVNTSRGSVVDEQALVRALSAKKIAGAALDVFEREPKLASGLAKLDNVLLSPHTGSATNEARSRMAEAAARNVIAVLSGKGAPFSLVA